MSESGMPDRERYERARQRVELLRGFYGHAIVFVVVNLGLAAYNLATTTDRLWFVLTFAGWGIGLIAHGAYVFGSNRFLGADWQERKIREALDREDRVTR
ncbi:MAG: 2TM domain-containing protein [Candidatus Limnocylindrales bacterium]